MSTNYINIVFSTCSIQKHRNVETLKLLDVGTSTFQIQKSCSFSCAIKTISSDQHLRWVFDKFSSFLFHLKVSILTVKMLPCFHELTSYSRFNYWHFLWLVGFKKRAALSSRNHFFCSLLLIILVLHLSSAFPSSSFSEH